MFASNLNARALRRRPVRRARPPGFADARGFTLTELIVTVSILAVIAAFAAPSMSGMIANNNRATRLNTMVSALTFARGYAVANNTAVTVCESADGQECNTPDTGRFENGWIVFVDGAAQAADSVRDGVRHPHDDATAENNELLLKAFQPDMKGVAFFELQESDNSVLGFVTFNTQGRPLGDARNAKVRYCDNRGSADARRVAISPTGQVSTDDDDGIGLHCP